MSAQRGFYSASFVPNTASIGRSLLQRTVSQQTLVFIGLFRTYGTSYAFRPLFDVTHSIFKHIHF